MFNKARILSLSRARKIQSTSSHPIPWTESIRNLSQADKNLKVACNTTVLEPVLWDSTAELCFLSQL